MIDEAYAMSGAGGEGGPGAFTGFVFPLVIVMAIFYFILIRPQLKRQKQHQSMLTSLQRGDKVITTGGIHGTIVGLKDDVVVLKVADTTKLEVSKSAIAGVKSKEGTASTSGGGS
jgi:preprotein translocase subunit YajC